MSHQVTDDAQAQFANGNLNEGESPENKVVKRLKTGANPPRRSLCTSSERTVVKSCSCPVCVTRSKSWGNFKVHMKRCHYDELEGMLGEARFKKGIVSNSNEQKPGAGESDSPNNLLQLQSDKSKSAVSRDEDEIVGKASDVPCMQLEFDVQKACAFSAKSFSGPMSYAQQERIRSYMKRFHPKSSFNMTKTFPVKGKHELLKEKLNAMELAGKAVDPRGNLQPLTGHEPQVLAQMEEILMESECQHQHHPDVKASSSHESERQIVKDNAFPQSNHKKETIIGHMFAQDFDSIESSIPVTDSFASTGKRGTSLMPCGIDVLSPNGKMKRKLVSPAGRNHAKRFRCDLCDFSYSSQSNLNRHKEKHEQEKKVYKCDTCGNVFTNMFDITRHVESEHGPKPHKCKKPGCKASFYAFLQLKEHEDECHKTLTENETPVKSNQNSRTQEGDIFKGPQCTPEVEPLVNVKEANKCDGVLEPIGPTKTGTKKTGNSKNSWVQENDSFKKPQRMLSLEPPETQKQVNKCDVCGKEYTTRFDLRTHFRFEHGPKRHKCKKPGCKERFVLISELQNHVCDSHKNTDENEVIRTKVEEPLCLSKLGQDENSRNHENCTPSEPPSMPTLEPNQSEPNWVPLQNSGEKEALPKTFVSLIHPDTRVKVQVDEQLLLRFITPILRQNSAITGVKSTKQAYQMSITEIHTGLKKLSLENVENLEEKSSLEKGVKKKKTGAKNTVKIEVQTIDCQ